MDPARKLWNDQQQALRKAVSRRADHEQAVELFLRQHGMVHAGIVSEAEGPTFEDEVWDGLDEAAARIIPAKMEHSIAWLCYHVARCEDITMNLLLAGTAQVLREGGWVEKMGIGICDTGNSMDMDAIRLFSTAIDLQALRAYHAAVGRRTREIVASVPAGCFTQPVNAARLPRIIEEGAVLPEAVWLINYWGGLTLGGLLLMPPTRHCLVHINEAMRIREKCAR
jgi:hypothetical protein